jgi:hypothetical protein
MVMYRSRVSRGVNCMKVQGILDIINTIDRCCGAVRQFAGVSLCLSLPLSLAQCVDQLTVTVKSTFIVTEHSIPGFGPRPVKDPGLGLLICSFAGRSREQKLS